MGYVNSLECKSKTWNSKAVEGALLAAFLVFLAGPIMALRLPMGQRSRATRSGFTMFQVSNIILYKGGPPMIAINGVNTPYKWPYWIIMGNWGCFTLLIGVITLFKIGAHLVGHWAQHLIVGFLRSEDLLKFGAWSTHSIHVWCIYLHSVVFLCKCR